jgi:Glycosyltransferase family 87
MSQSRRVRLRTAAPYLVATAWLVLGWAFLVRGVEHPGVAYRPWAFRAHAYSDLLAMTGDRYLQGGRPLPYVEDRIEYPVLLGLALWAPSFLPGGQVVHFTFSVLVLWACLMASVALLRRLPGASPWWLAGTPAIAYYGALNWDLIPIALLLAAVVAAERERPAGAGALAALGVSAKLWPVAFLPGAVAALAVRGRLAALARAGAAFLLVTAAVNLPVAIAAPESWAWFWRYNGQRSAENSVWEALGVKHPGTLNAITAAFLLAAVAAAVVAAWRAAPEARWRAVRIGTALVLVTWVGVNKVWSPQYALYAFAAGALAAGPRWAFLSLAAVSVVDYHLAFEVRAERGIFWFHDRWYDGEELVRAAIYAAFAAWLALRLRETRAGPGEAARGIPA